MSDPEPARRLYRNARREALTVTVVWVVALVWTVGSYYFFGLRHDADSFPVARGIVEAQRVPGVVLGFPDWVFFGIIVPWVGCSIFTFLFGLTAIADDDLGAEAHDTEGAAHGH